MSKRESIHGSIQILWERGWPVTPENVKKMCASGAHVIISLEEAREAIERVEAGEQDAWLSRFSKARIAPGYTDEDWAGRYKSWLNEPEWTQRAEKGE